MGRYRSMKHPVHYSATPALTHSDPPILDQDGDDIREALGLPKNTPKKKEKKDDAVWVCAPTEKLE